MEYLRCMAANIVAKPPTQYLYSIHRLTKCGKELCSNEIQIEADRQKFYHHVKLRNWQVLKVIQIDVGHQSWVPSLSNMIK